MVLSHSYGFNLQKQNGFSDWADIEPTITRPLYATWECCNTLIVSWLLNSLSQPIAQSVIFFESVIAI